MTWQSVLIYVAGTYAVVYVFWVIYDNATESYYECGKYYRKRG